MYIRIPIGKIALLFLFLGFIISVVAFVKAEVILKETGNLEMETSLLAAWVGFLFVFIIWFVFGNDGDKLHALRIITIPDIQKFAWEKGKGRVGDNYLERKFGNPIHIERIEGGDAIRIRNKSLSINHVYILHIVEEHPVYNMCKVIAIHRRHPEFDGVFLIGRDKFTEQLFIIGCPPEYYAKPIQECLNWCLGIDKNQKIIEV